MIIRPLMTKKILKYGKLMKKMEKSDKNKK